MTSSKLPASMVTQGVLIGTLFIVGFVGFGVFVNSGRAVPNEDPPDLTGLSGCSWNEASLADTWVSGATWFQTWWEPCTSCCNRTRIGVIGDGGKWVCMDTPIAGTTVVSVGSNNLFSFEESLIKDYGVNKVIVYDHTSFPPEDDLDGRIEFRKEMATTDNMRVVLAKEKPSIFKIDCEGCEGTLLPEVFTSTFAGTVSQILVEVHWPFWDNPIEVASSLWKHLDAVGYGAFSKEANIQSGDGSCVEYALIHTGK